MHTWHAKVIFGRTSVAATVNTSHVSIGVRPQDERLVSLSLMPMSLVPMSLLSLSVVSQRVSLSLQRGCSEGRTRTGDTAIMSRLLYHLSYPALGVRLRTGTPSRSPEPLYGIEP